MLSSDYRDNVEKKSIKDGFAIISLYMYVRFSFSTFSPYFSDDD